MVTAEHVYNHYLKEFCDLFGFDFKRHLLVKPTKKEVVMMHAILSENVFYRDILKKKYDSFDIRDESKVKELRKKAEAYFSKVEGGSGVLNWQQDKHELIYQVLKVITKEQAINIFWYPKYINEADLKKSLPNQWHPYIPEFVPILKFIAFTKFIYPEWISLIEECRATCLEYEKLNSGESKYLPWHWGRGNITSHQHAAIIHESLHNILRNSGVVKTYEAIFKEGHNAWNEGIDVFFHRKSGLFLGYYKANHWWYRNRPKHYWKASQPFWEEFEHITEKRDFKLIPIILSNPNDDRTIRIAQYIKTHFDPKHFHD